MGRSFADHKYVTRPYGKAPAIDGIDGTARNDDLQFGKIVDVGGVIPVGDYVVQGQAQILVRGHAGKKNFSHVRIVRIFG